MNSNYNYSFVMNWGYQPNVCNDRTLLFTQNIEIVHNKNILLEISINDRIFSQFMTTKKRPFTDDIDIKTDFVI